MTEEEIRALKRDDPYYLPGKKYDAKFTLDYQSGMAIMKEKLPDRDLSYITSFTLDMTSTRTQLVGLMSDGTVDVAVPLEAELQRAALTGDVDTYLELMTGVETQNCKKAGWAFAGVVCVGCLIAGAILYCLSLV